MFALPYYNEWHTFMDKFQTLVEESLKNITQWFKAALIEKAALVLVDIYIFCE